MNKLLIIVDKLLTDLCYKMNNLFIWLAVALLMRLKPDKLGIVSHAYNELLVIMT
jgi:hypothetical protein